MSSVDPVAAALERWQRLPETAPADEIWGAGDELARLLRAANPPAGAESSPEPATPAVWEGPEAALKRGQMAMEWCGGVGQDALVSLMTELRALLAEVARLTEGLAVEQKRVEDHRENELFWMNQAERKGATLATVRKIAENYHDVDQVGDPPREVACNPCAAEILNVLEGR